MSTLKNIGVIGLGSMGMGMAQSLVKANFDVYGFDLNPKALDTLSQAGAKAVSTDASEYAHLLHAVVLVVVNAKQVRQILLDSGFAAKLPPKTPVIVCSTISAEDAISISESLTALDLRMLDAPISGGSIKAMQGEITMMTSGPKALFDELHPVLDAMSKKAYWIHEAIGKGATVKIIHQLLAGVHIAVAAEAMAMAAKADIPLDLMYDVVINAAGNSWMFENRMKHVLDGDYTPHSMVDIFVKDLGLVIDTAKSINFPTPLASTAMNMFTSASNCGLGKEDDAAVIKTFHGLNLPKKKES